MSSSERTSVQFGTLATNSRNAIVGGPFGSNLVSSDYVHSGVPVIRGQNMGEGRWIGGEFVFVSEEKAESLRANWARPGDIIFTQRGTLGQVAIVPNGPWDHYVVSQSQMKATIDTDKADALYIYYFFSSPEQQQYIIANSIQTGVPHTNLTQLRAHPVLVPRLSEQRSIVGILSAIDDKIEHNRRTEGVIEQLGQAIFQAWFVDFEPVKAKAAGSSTFPSMARSVFDALPARLVDSEIGFIPEGWEVMALTDIFEVNPARSRRKGELAPYLDMKNMPTHGHSPDEIITRPVGSGARFSNGDTLLARITPCLENGKTAFIDFLNEGEIGWGSTEYIVLKPRPPIPPIFAYLLARSREFRRFAIQAMTGTSGRQRVPFSALSHYKIAGPCTKTLAAFGELVNPLIERSSAGSRESKRLVQLRNLLLPRLLSGKLRVTF